jgi:low affinity Fe/Cu permease
MLSHLYSLINMDYLAISAKYDKLIISLRTAQANDVSLEKEETSYDDILDATRLSLRCYGMK